MSERDKSYCESACESCPRLDRIAELEALMETADEVAAKAAYARGWELAMKAAVEAVLSVPANWSIWSNRAVDAIRAVKMGEEQK